MLVPAGYAPKSRFQWATDHKAGFAFFVMALTAQVSQFSVVEVPPSERETQANFFLWMNKAGEAIFLAGVAVSRATPGDEVPAEPQPARFLSRNSMSSSGTPSAEPQHFPRFLGLFWTPLRDSISKLNSLPHRKYLNGCEHSRFAHS